MFVHGLNSLVYLTSLNPSTLRLKGVSCLLSKVCSDPSRMCSESCHPLDSRAPWTPTHLSLTTRIVDNTCTCLRTSFMEIGVASYLSWSSCILTHGLRVFKKCRLFNECCGNIKFNTILPLLFEFFVQLYSSSSTSTEGYGGVSKGSGCYVSI